MNAGHLNSVLTSFARRLGAEVCRSAQHPALYYIDLESEHPACAYVRLGVDADCALAVVETVFALSAILPADRATLENLLALQVRLGPAQSGERFFPVLDMGSEHVGMVYLVGSEMIRGEEDLASIVHVCSVEAARLVKDVREAPVVQREGASFAGAGHRLQARSDRERL